MQRYVPLLVGIVVLLVGTVWLSSDDSSSAAAVLVGSGLAIGVEGFRFRADEGRRERERTETSERWRRQDLEETRRLLYTALALTKSSENGKAEVAATVANALAHHSRRITQSEAYVLLDELVSAGAGAGGVHDKLKTTIEQITAHLGDEAPLSS